MKKEQFIARREADWRALDRVLRRLENPGKATSEEVAKFSRLHRAVSYDLSTVRSRHWGRDIEQFLNALVRRGHACLYRAKPRPWRAILDFVLRGFPRLLRANGRIFLLACAIFTIPGTVVGSLVYNRPAIADRILPAAAQQRMDEMYSEKGAKEVAASGRTGMGGFYVYNNVGIALRCFALGIVFGIGSLLILMFNSVMLGAVFGFVLSRGHHERLLSFVIGHGAFELTAIAIAGAAGFILGLSIVHPGQLRRIDALRERGLVAVQLAAGAALMLVVAAAIEAFWSPLPTAPIVRYVVGGALWFVVFVYLAFAGRRRPAGGVR